MTLTRLIVVLILSAATLAVAGCAAAGWLAQGVVAETGIDMAAEYRGLEGKRVAVLVDADLDVQFRYPLTQLEVATAVSQQLRDGVAGITVLDARQTVDFQNRNIYWRTKPYSDLASRLQVDRLLLIDVVDYRLHEKGNVNIWKGHVAASVGVAEADGATPDDFAYSTQVVSSYPPDRPEGALNANPNTIRLGLMDLFARSVATKFFEHRVEPEEK